MWIFNIYNFIIIHSPKCDIVMLSVIQMGEPLSYKMSMSNTNGDGKGLGQEKYFCWPSFFSSAATVLITLKWRYFIILISVLKFHRTRNLYKCIIYYISKYLISHRNVRLWQVARLNSAAINCSSSTLNINITLPSMCKIHLSTLIITNLRVVLKTAALI